MLLKVGELAKRAGLTVRTLHHYDSIGLLRPSARSDSDYRLYNQGDIARLHGIQALRGLGLPLDEIGRLLDSGGADLPLIVERQLTALEDQIRQSNALRQRLHLLQAKFASGREPELDDWLSSLQLMTTCDSYFTPAEMKLIFGNWPAVEADWQQLVADVHALMATGVGSDDPLVQPLAQRWMNLMHDWMRGDFDLMERWGRMYFAEPGLHAGAGPNLAMVSFIDQAVQLRLALMRRYISDAELRSLGNVPQRDWNALAEAVQGLLDARTAPSSPQARSLLMRWLALAERTTRGDAQLRAKLQQAYESEPLLRLGAHLSEAQRAYLMQAAGQAQSEQA
ncbi:MAG: MerR family transcriptional regulator [Burkholderiaceae bacterium]|nr:MerR family transcriptional regulator [Burkholderiaceae bacterium]